MKTLPVVALVAALASPAALAGPVGKCAHPIEKDRKGNVLVCGDPRPAGKAPVPEISLHCKDTERILVNHVTFEGKCIAGGAGKMWTFVPACKKDLVAELAEHREVKDVPYWTFDCVTLEKAQQSSICHQMPWRCRTGKVWRHIEDAVVSPEERARREEECRKQGGVLMPYGCHFGPSDIIGVRG